MNPQTRRGGSAAEGNLLVSETVGSTVSSANADCAGASVASCPSVPPRSLSAPAAPRHPGWRRRQPARLFRPKAPAARWVPESCSEPNGRLQHGSRQAAVPPVKCHGRGCQEHEAALSAAKPRTGVVLPRRSGCRSGARPRLFCCLRNSRAAVLAFLQKRGKKLFQNISHT